MSPKLSVCMVVHNEEKLIGRCLDSLEGLDAEIVIVHDGPCADRTIEIAENYGARIFIEPFGGSSEFHRVASYEHAHGEWILQLDADEFLTAELRDQIPRLIEAEAVDAYSVNWPMFDGKLYVPGPFNATMRGILYRKSELYFIGITHESPQTYGKLELRPELMLEHRPLYDNYTLSKLKTKWFRWGRYQATQIANLNRAPLFNVASLESLPQFRYYRSWMRHPYRKAAVLSWVLLRAQIGYYMSSWSQLRTALIFKNWLVLGMLSANYFYLARQIQLAR